MLITNISGLAQVREGTPSLVSGKAMAILPVLEDAFLAIKDGKIASYGTMPSLGSTSADQVIDARGRFVFPAFVDSHTHLVFAASREEEFVMKIKGAGYAEIAASGGGILNSARKLQLMPEDELYERSLKRAKEIMDTGTGAVEIKSGYGLTVADELKMLRVARRLGRETPLKVKTTFLGAHAIPQAYTKEGYVDLVVKEMIPAVAEEKLADYIDVFCEEGFFSPAETELICEEGKRFGMRPRIHANQLHRSGGVQVGVKVNAISVDHLENIGVEEIEALQGSTTIPTALPGAAFFLNLSFPPARDIINAGLPLAIASDYNPGSSPSGNMPLMVALACIKMRMSPEEAFNAATINTAAAMEILEDYGSITKGKTANVCITQPMPSLAYLPYSFGSPPIDKVILNGQLMGQG
ncbi:MAG: imidazolonepropionase [Cyclobacteriaceae bacterium]|nr:imidazolonepropionase [Cyclobacteriaceae bacterium]MCB0498465.1 imidazolonepropionase [Cyclobacteriaceae bacterium]MCW5901325.1 imidazolonepropionase [Cyclobacteriaceae bacterium]